METLSLRGAADSLESQPNLTRVRLTVLRPSNNNDDDEPSDYDAQQVDRFVSAMENHRTIRVASFVKCPFGWCQPDIERHFERLYCSALPRHASLRSVSLSWCGIPASYLQRMLMMPAGPSSSSSSSSSSLKSSIQQLSLYDCCLEPRGEAVRALAAALGRGGSASLTELSLARCSLNSKQCRILFEGASESRTLVSLSVVETEHLRVRACTLERAVGFSSSLRTLRVGAKWWTRSGIASVVRLLRTNDTLESLDVSGERSGELHAHIRTDLLSTYNFSLRYVPCGAAAEPEQQVEMDRLLDRNVRVRHDYDRLHDDGIPRVGSGVELGAEAFARVSRFPTLLYRLLRQIGCGVALADQCLQQHHPSHNRRRKRKIPFSGATADDGPAVRRSRRA
jgi:hypothetical protein